MEANVTDKFMSTLNSYILNDAIRSLKQDSEEPYQIDEVEFTEENLVALDDSEVARKVARRSYYSCKSDQSPQRLFAN